MLTLITHNPAERKVKNVLAVGSDHISTSLSGDAILVEPVFHDFRLAGDNELGYAFVAIGNLAPRYQRMTVALTYSQANAQVYKGYLQELVEALKQTYAHVKLLHVPFITCGVPLMGSVLMITGSHEEFKPLNVKEVVMPSTYFPGMLSHVPRNRPNFQIGVSSRAIGAVRSDLNLLPSLQSWKGRSLMVEYQTGKTTTTQRMTPEHVSRLMGTLPASYNDDLSLCLPAGVIEAFI